MRRLVSLQDEKGGIDDLLLRMNYVGGEALVDSLQLRSLLTEDFKIIGN